MIGKTEARDRLLGLVGLADAMNQNTTPEEAVEAAVQEAILNQPSLRNCLYPRCLREFDMTARINGWEPARPAWSGDGWHQATRGVSHGSICPDHVAIVTEHLGRPVELPNGRWMVVCACGWMSRPQTYGGLLRPLWEEHLLTAAGTLQAPVTAVEGVERVPLAEHTEESLNELYDALDDTDHYCAETREAAQAMFKAWDWHRKTLGGVSSAINAIRNMMRTSADFLDHRDWQADRIDAYLWAILIGWDDALEEVADTHRWDEHRLAYVRRMRGYLAPITEPQPEQETAR